MPTPDCREIRTVLHALPPPRTSMILTLDQALAAIRTSYGITPGAPVLSSQRKQPGRS